MEGVLIVAIVCISSVAMVTVLVGGSVKLKVRPTPKSRGEVEINRRRSRPASTPSVDPTADPPEKVLP